MKTLASNLSKHEVNRMMHNTFKSQQCWSDATKPGGKGENPKSQPNKDQGKTPTVTVEGKVKHIQ